MARRPRRSGTKPPKPPEQSAELRGSPKMGVAVISGATFTNKSVVYYDLEGAAIVEGDICLGKVADVQKTMDAAREAVRPIRRSRSAWASPGASSGGPTARSRTRSTRRCPTRRG